ncbi:hypothetical protein, partial [Nocardia cyriacigeorgica]|uniref:hypothetical protein n=1 Tax=Nocardia cyriacigeorgica TaxID=135487 RepID=UPI00245905DD
MEMTLTEEWLPKRGELLRFSPTAAVICGVVGIVLVEAAWWVTASLRDEEHKVTIATRTETGTSETSTRVLKNSARHPIRI